LKNKNSPLKVLGECILLFVGVFLFAILFLIYFPTIFGEGVWQGATIYMVLLIVVALLGLRIKKITKLEWDWSWRSGKTIIRRAKTKDEKEEGGKHG